LELRDENCFMAHDLLGQPGAEKFWEQVLENHPNKGLILSWVKEVHVEDFFVPFNGKFKGKVYKSSLPSRARFPNNPLAVGEFKDFISEKIREDSRSGAVLFWGKEGECEPPLCVLPISVEPKKPRMIHDDRFLNLWSKDSPFQLETLKSIPSWATREIFTIDLKSGYHHIKISKDSRKYFGFLWEGNFYVYTVMPFGWKCAPFIFQSITSAVAVYLRSMGVASQVYLDDFIVQAD
jgi:hypothetical protein